jgi:hypothetical protein
MTCATAAAFVPSARAGTYAPNAYAPLTQDIVVQQVPGAPVYYTLGHPGVPSTANQGHTSNAGFVVTDDGVVVFDALGTPSLGRALLQKIRAVTDKPVKYVALSHYHWITQPPATSTTKPPTPGWRNAERPCRPG